jgi:hypothetical protein
MDKDTNFFYQVRTIIDLWGIASGIRDIIYTFGVGGAVVIGIIASKIASLNITERIILGIGLFIILVAILWAIGYIIQRGRKPKIEFYRNRTQLNDIRGQFEKQIKYAKQIWISVWVGTMLVPWKTFEKEKGKVTKIMLQHPNAKYLEITSENLNEPIDTYKNNIIQNTKNALELAKQGYKIQVYWTLEPIAGIVIANPEKKDGIGWAKVDTYLPWTIADKYPSYIVYEDSQADLFQEVLRAFKESFGEHEDDKHKNDRTNGNRLFEVTKDNFPILSKEVEEYYEQTKKNQRGMANK